MAPLADYPAKPAMGEENGYTKLEAWDRVVESNIEEAYALAASKISPEEAALAIEAVELEVAKKADAEATNEALASKASHDDLENGLNGKADKTALDTVNDRVGDAETGIATAQAAATDALADSATAISTAESASSAAGSAQAAAAAASAAVDTRYGPEDIAGLNKLGIPEAIYIPKNGVVPGGLPVRAIVIEDA